jgi:hypothetical protein
MTSNVFLDPEKIGALEPSEGDERNKAMLSPFAVPRSVSVEFRDGKAVSSIQFHYSGAEMEGGREPLDDRKDPSVMVRISIPTNKILELAFSPAVGMVDLKHIAERLEECARSISTKGKRLSYRMTARILLMEWAESLVHVTEGAG